MELVLDLSPALCFFFPKQNMKKWGVTPEFCTALHIWSFNRNLNSVKKINKKNQEAVAA